jgi:hypothetical protein
MSAAKIRPLHGQRVVEKNTATTPHVLFGAIVQQSRAAYNATGRPCACPDDLARNGGTRQKVSPVIGLAVSGIPSIADILLRRGM